MAEHLAFLEAKAPSIKAAGPLSGADTGAAAGGLWLVEAESLNAAQALYRADLFWPTGLRKSVQVLHWRRVLANGRRLP